MVLSPLLCRRCEDMVLLLVWLGVREELASEEERDWDKLVVMEEDRENVVVVVVVVEMSSSL